MTSTNQKLEDLLEAFFDNIKQGKAMIEFEATPEQIETMKRGESVKVKVLHDAD